LSSPDITWNVPERFNFARDVVEALAAEPARRALTSVDADGVIVRSTFADISVAAARWAGLFRSRGLTPGDRVLVMLGKEPSWPEVMVAALKSGLIGALFRGAFTSGHRV
jgi:acyl-coenzyme A synthetase/AMP-(fatty) acid ligase